MKVEQFWNKAFLAALTRLPADEAKAEADKATELCIKRWQSFTHGWRPSHIERWRRKNIFKLPPTLQGREESRTIKSRLFRLQILKHRFSILRYWN
ncbi:hypothetical protein [Xanthomonas sontii]|uniref:hypothetical protein n=1 Tax=Xanthomonas sontii TaxID=2650745 RepID=UPI00168BE373|nr:hypothetical protein [Xanthomonas sontii]